MHEQLAEETRLVFAGLSVILLGMYTLPRLMRREDNRLLTSFVPSAFLVLYAVGIVFLINTAYAGSRLVHEFGIHAVFPAAESVDAAPGPSSVTATNR